ncbi:hypothetical protein HYU90_01345 [Candidatus Collierbacteria bacterium]|nr:hypothetical protein [Candidatus Collierbacteria bacterium]
MAKGEPVTKEVLMDVLMEFHHEVQEPVMNEVLDRMGNLENRMGNLENRMGNLENEMGTLETRMDGIESEVEGLKKAVWNVSDHQGKKLDNHEERIFALEEDRVVVVS